MRSRVRKRRRWNLTIKVSLTKLKAVPHSNRRA
jgi:hypothetical protein